MTALDSATCERLLSSSLFLQRVRRRFPEDWDNGRLTQAVSAEQMAQRLQQALPSDADATAVMQGLRLFRQREMAGIAVRDLAGLAPLDDSLQALSSLADLCLQRAHAQVSADLQARFGDWRADSTAAPAAAAAAPAAAAAAVIAMGKLGGCELNFSSDIDLIFVHDGTAETTGGLSAEEFFVRLAQGVQTLLARVTAEGFVFRVDTLLRPFGSVGPLSIGVDAAQRYYREHGREWERYAMVKARACAGQLDVARKLIAQLQGFVYRRYLDFNAIHALAELKGLIEDDVQRRGRVDDVKLGRGGIREIEFIVQSFQLTRGGQVPALRSNRLRPVLRWLGEHGLLPLADARRLDESYVFLRRLENALQIYDDQQVQQLPTQAAPREALCRALDYPDYDALYRRYQAVSAQVRAQFAQIFAQPVHAVVAPELPAAGAVVVPAATAEAQAASSTALDALRAFQPRALLNDAAQTRLRQLLDRLCRLCSAQAEPGVAAERVLTLLQAIGGRSTYLALLYQSPTACEQLVRLCASSAWMARQLASTPQTLALLIEPSALYRAPPREQMRRELAQRLAGIALDDVEAGMDALRHFRCEQTLRIAASDVAGELPLVKVSDHLTWLAEVVVDAALQRVWDTLRRSHGEALRRDGQPAAFIAVAYGKFGGWELGYGSDLDLVFIHDCDATDGETTGPRPVPAQHLLTRVGQQLIHWLSTLTPAGRAYEVDTELRPSGRSGLPVVGIDGFARYQREQAWTWEHQALSRARAVAGSEALGQRFAALRIELLTAPRDLLRLRRDVLEMRERMRAHLDRARTRWNVKQGRGGLIDIEFITQYLLLRHANAHPAIVDYPDNWRQLEAMLAAGVIDAASRDLLLRTYRVYRHFTHACALQGLPLEAAADAFVAERNAIGALWDAVFAESPSSG